MSPYRPPRSTRPDRPSCPGLARIIMRSGLNVKRFAVRKHDTVQHAGSFGDARRHQSVFFATGSMERPTIVLALARSLIPPLPVQCSTQRWALPCQLPTVTNQLVRARFSTNALLGSTASPCHARVGGGRIAAFQEPVPYSVVFSVMLTRFGDGAPAAGFQSSSRSRVRSRSDRQLINIQTTQRLFPATNILWRDPPCRGVVSPFILSHPQAQCWHHSARTLSP
jgi:hypothetical protein